MTPLPKLAQDHPSSPSIRKHRRTRSNFLKPFSHHSPPPLDRRPFPSTTDNPPKRILPRKLSLDNLFTTALKTKKSPSDSKDKPTKSEQAALPSIRSLRNKFSISLRPEGSTRRHFRRVSESVRWNAPASAVPATSTLPPLDFSPELGLTTSAYTVAQSYKETEITHDSKTDSFPRDEPPAKQAPSTLQPSPSPRKRPSLTPLLITSPVPTASKPETSAFGTPLEQLVFLARNDDCTSWADVTPPSSPVSLIAAVQDEQGLGWWSSSKPRPTSLAQSTFGVDELAIDLGSPTSSSRFSTPSRRRIVDEEAEDRRIERLEQIANTAVSPRLRAASALGRAPHRAVATGRAASYGEYRSRPVSGVNTLERTSSSCDTDKHTASRGNLFSLRASRTSSDTFHTARQPLRSPFLDSDLASHRSSEIGRSSSPRDALIITPHSRSGSVETVRSRHALEKDALLKALMSAKREIVCLKEDNSGLQTLLAEGMVEREELRMSLREVQDELERLQKLANGRGDPDELSEELDVHGTGDRLRRSSVSSSLFACLPPDDMSMLINAKMDIDNVICSTPALHRRRSFPKRVGFQETVSPPFGSKRPNPDRNEPRPRKISTGSSTTHISNILSFADTSFDENESEASVSWVLKLREDDEAHLDDL